MNIIKQIFAAIRSGPVLLMGPPGVGKTAIIRSLSDLLAEKYGRQVVRVVLWGPQISQLHFGAPVIDPPEKGIDGIRTVSLALNRQLAEKLADPNVIVLLIVEDITAAGQSVLSFLLGIFDNTDPRLLDYPLPRDRVLRVATGNERGSAATIVLPPLMGRCAVIRYVPDLSQWPQDFLGYWGNEAQVIAEYGDLVSPDWAARWKVWRSRIAGFLLANPRFIYTEDPEPGKPFVSPRAWDLCSRALAFAGDELGDEEVNALARGYMPPEPAAAFSQYVAGLRLPPVLDIIRGGTLQGFRPDQVLVIAGMIQAWWQGKVLSFPDWEPETFLLLVREMRQILDECYRTGRGDLVSLMTEGWMPAVIKGWDRVEAVTGVRLYGHPDAMFPPHWGEAVALVLRTRAQLIKNVS